MTTLESYARIKKMTGIGYMRSGDETICTTSYSGNRKMVIVVVDCKQECMRINRLISFPELYNETAIRMCDGKKKRELLVLY
jgi:hypothetical protein